MAILETNFNSDIQLTVEGTQDLLAAASYYAKENFSTMEEYFAAARPF